MTNRPAAARLPSLPLAMALTLLAGAAQAAPCRLPPLESGGQAGPALERDRAALRLYEACLESEREVAALLDPEAARQIDRQREAAAGLRRTLDAWSDAVARAAEAKPAGS
ncbi:hypothetical protein HHL28_14510 [Aerophototrophica crusticola]|uniref:Uncharacterized protein n=1 Tax=Aerophototrophica crusticola TaxID=1709002 RepID=A0A858RAX6_9PROT|nr:hypothetical protein HHL28_14510 [Rhodospirillaceae bacterium B3]